jgi:hypothetical protein
MPFFLVTQTLLVEAQDENEAAQKGIDRLRSGDQASVVVKSDETTITHIVVQAKLGKPAPVPTLDAVNQSPAAVRGTEVALATPPTRKLILKRMMADARALLWWRA